jgi:hypothetical protein
MKASLRWPGGSDHDAIETHRSVLRRPRGNLKLKGPAHAVPAKLGNRSVGMQSDSTVGTTHRDIDRPCNVFGKLAVRRIRRRNPKRGDVRPPLEGLEIQRRAQVGRRRKYEIELR